MRIAVPNHAPESLDKSWFCERRRGPFATQEEASYSSTPGVSTDAPSDQVALRSTFANREQNPEPAQLLTGAGTESEVTELPFHSHEDLPIPRKCTNRAE